MSDKNKQELLNILYQIFSMSGAFTEVKQLDNLRTLSGKLSILLAAQAKEESVELMRSLQKAVIKGFKETFAATSALEARVTALEEKGNDSQCCGACTGKDRGSPEGDSETSNSD